MNWTAEIRRTFEQQGHAPDPDIVEELAQHAAAAYERARADGATHDEAQRQVSDGIAAGTGAAELRQRRPRRSPAVEPPPAVSHGLSGFTQDVRYAWRLFRRQPGHTLLAVLTMALGIGATTALFSVVNGVLIAPLPWPDADRMVRLRETHEGGNNRFSHILTNASYLAWKDNPRTLEAIAGYRSDRVTLTGFGSPERLRVATVTPSLFPLLRAVPQTGRLFGAGEERRRVVVLSYGLWQQRFGGDPGVVGKPIRLDGEPYEVVGVMPRTFAFPDRETRAWLPYDVPPVMGATPNSRSISMMTGLGRLRPGATVAQAETEGSTRSRNGPDLGMVGIAVFGTKAPATITAVPLLDAMTSDVRPALIVFLVGVGLLLVTATANVASLQLARSTTRRREMAIRSALGAGSRRLARQLLVEGSMVGLAGGVAGLLLAATMNRALVSILPPDFPRLDAIAIDVRVAIVALGLSLATGLVFGLLPAWQARRVDVVSSLAEDSLAPVGGGMRSPVARARAWIMAGQVGIACVLLVGAGLVSRTFLALLAADRGYDPANVVTAELALPDESFSPARRAEVMGSLLERLRGQPGVRYAAVSNMLPLIPTEALMGFTMPARRGGSGMIDAQATVRVVSPGYFEALGIRLMAGRTFTRADTASAASVVMVSRTFAARYLDQPLVGSELPVNADGGGQDRPSIVVGVVDDIRQRSATDPPQSELYFCQLQRTAGYGSSQAFITVRTSGDPLAFVPTLRSLVRETGETLMIESVTTMSDRLWQSLLEPRLYAWLVGGFAILALAIAGVGLFGVLSYSVAQRTREIGVRAALGATPAAIVGMVLLQGLAVTAGGLAAGLVASYWLAGLIGTFLYGVSAHDVTSFAAAALLLLLVAVVACVVPARRASRVDPQRALRSG